MGGRLCCASRDIRYSYRQNTYEGIVKRRKDPSILYKRGNDNYELRIFPMAGNESRKVRITYLVPVEWRASKVTAALPINILESSKYPVNNFSVNISKTLEWKNPSIFGGALNKSPLFSGDNNSLFILNSSELKSYHSISFANPMKDGIYCSNYKEGNTGYFQMALSPSLLYKFNKGRKILFVVDYDSSRTDYTKKEVMNNLYEACMANLNLGDSINLICKQGGASSLVNNTWLAYEPNKLEGYLQQLHDRLDLGGEERGAVHAALDVAKKEKDPVNVIWITSSESGAKTDSLLSDLRKPNVEVPPFHIVLYSNKKLTQYYGENNMYSYYSYIYAYNSLDSTHKCNLGS